MKSFKQSLFLFLGVSLMVIFSQLNYVLLRDLKDMLIFQKAGPELIPMMKVATIPLTILVGLLLIAISRGGKIKRAFHVFFSSKCGLLDGICLGFPCDALFFERACFSEGVLSLG